MAGFDGGAIPAHPLALTAERRLDERRQAALTRYYCEAGASGIAVGVHTTQFAIRDSKVGLLAPVLQLAAAVQGNSKRKAGGVCSKSRGSAAIRRKPCAKPNLLATHATTPRC